MYCDGSRQDERIRTKESPLAAVIERRPIPVDGGGRRRGVAENLDQSSHVGACIDEIARCPFSAALIDRQDVDRRPPARCTARFVGLYIPIRRSSLYPLSFLGFVENSFGFSHHNLYFPLLVIRLQCGKFHTSELILLPL